MTPLPVTSRLSLAPPGEDTASVPRGSRCAAPGCGRTAAHQHHAVSRSTQRSLFGHVFDYLQIDGRLTLILVDLCSECHDKLESGVGGCKSRLRWAGGWAWYDRLREVTMPTGPIVWFDPKNLTYWKMRGFCDGEY